MKIMIVKAILNTDQEVEIYNSLNDPKDLISVIYNEIPNEVSLSLTATDSDYDLPLHAIWTNFMQSIEDHRKNSIKTILVLSDADTVVLEQNNVSNYVYQATFETPLKESINFEFFTTE